MMPSPLPASSWTLRAPSLSQFHASNKSTCCFCGPCLAAALPDPHFHKKISTSFVFYSAAHKLCLHNLQMSLSFLWDLCLLFHLCQKRGHNFLTLILKVSPNSLTTDFSTDSIHALPQVTDHFWWSAKRQGRGPSLFHLCSLLWLFSAQESKGQSWS